VRAKKEAGKTATQIKGRAGTEHWRQTLSKHRVQIKVHEQGIFANTLRIFAFSFGYNYHDYSKKKGYNLYQTSIDFSIAYYHMDYYSDASLSESDSDDDEERDEIYCQRELDYWEIEALLESRGPPPVIEYLAKHGSFALREMVLAPPVRIETVVGPSVVHSWERFWRGQSISKKSLFSADDWNAIGDFCRVLCSCVVPNPSASHVRSCMIQSLRHGRFKDLKR